LKKKKINKKGELSKTNGGNMKTKSSFLFNKDFNKKLKGKTKIGILTAKNV
jgi:hypothetical protein